MWIYINFNTVRNLIVWLGVTYLAFFLKIKIHFSSFGNNFVNFYFKMHKNHHNYLMRNSALKIEIKKKKK